MSRVKKRFHFWIYLLVYVMGTFIKISILKLLIVMKYLEYMSSHLEHTKKLIIYSQTLRLRRLSHFNKNLKATNEISDHGLLKGDTQRKLLIKKCRRSSLIFLRKLILRKMKKKVFLC